MRFAIEPRDCYVHAALWERETAEEMREFLLAVHAACAKHGRSKVLMLIRRSRPAFKPEEYGLTTYVGDLVTAACQIELVADTNELHTALGCIEMAARQEGINARAVREGG